MTTVARSSIATPRRSLAAATALMLVAALLWPIPAVASPSLLGELQDDLCNYGEIEMFQSIPAPESTLTIGCDAELDLHGHALSIRNVVVTGGHQFTIKDGSNDGDGRLTANATTAAGSPAIRTTGATLIIEGGTVIAAGGSTAAGIGGGDRGSGGTVSISGGTVTATGGSSGAGIGGGGRGSGGTVSISGGTVTATGGNNAAGIGGGSNGAGGGTVSISEGTVTATGGSSAAGIGGGYLGTGGTVDVGADAVVTAAGGHSAIGAGDGRVSFGLVVAGTLHLPTGNLRISSVDTVAVAASGQILGGTDDPTVGANFLGVGGIAGTIANQGVIALSASHVTAGGVSVSGHHYRVAFDAAGGSPTPEVVTVFASSFEAGHRVFPGDPTREDESVFGGWTDQPGGAGTPIDAMSTLPGSSTGPAVQVTAYALWSQVASVATSTITAAPTSIPANGTSTSTITVQAKDSNGHNLTTGNDLVELSTTAGDLSDVHDNKDGTYTATLTSSTTAGTETITGTLNDTKIDQDATVTFTVPVADAEKSTVVASEATVAADGDATSTVTVTLLDSHDIPREGKIVNLTQGSGSSTISPANSLSDATGKATFTVSSTTPETVTYTATSDQVTITDTAAVTFTGGVDADTSTVETSKARVGAEGHDTSTLTVTLRDLNDVPLQGHTVTLDQGDGKSTVSGGSEWTDGNGEITFTVSSTTPETVTYTAKSGSLAITDTATVTFTGGVDADTSTVEASKATVGADGNTTSMVTVTLRDLNGIPLHGHTVALDQGDGHSTIGQTGEHTDVNGELTVTVSSTTPETVTYTAKSGSLAITDSATVTFTGEVDVSKSTVTAAPTSVTANGTSASTITVQARDVNGNSLSVGGESVKLSSTRGTLSDVKDLGDGTYTASLTSTRAGTATISSLLNGSPLTDTATVTFTSVSTPSPTVPDAPDEEPETPDDEPEPPVEDRGVPELTDVVAGSTHADSIDRIYRYGITVGTSNTTFNPSGDLSRGQMSSFLVRLLVLTDPDIAYPDSHAAAMQLLVERGVLLGRADGSLDSSGTLTRGQAASVLVRVIEQATDMALATGDSFFPDAGDTHEENIAKLAELGVVSGYGDNTYRPHVELRRDQMASLIARTIDALIEAGKVGNLDA